MGHLINPISLQIKYHGSWRLSWNQYFRKDFSYFFFLDKYFSELVDSVAGLRKFISKFFFYELKYFLKNNSILFFFSFKMLRRKSAFRYYWHATMPFFLKYRYRFKNRNVLDLDPQKKFKRIFRSVSFKILKKKQEFFSLLMCMNVQNIYNCLYYRIKRVFSNLILLRKNFILLKLITFKLDFCKHKSFNKYLLNDLCLQIFFLIKLNLKKLF